MLSLANTVDCQLFLMGYTRTSTDFHKFAISLAWIAILASTMWQWYVDIKLFLEATVELLVALEMVLTVYLDMLEIVIKSILWGIV